MTQLKTPYDFYRLTEDQQAGLVGRRFMCPSRDQIFYPVHLDDHGRAWNYENEYGLLFITQVMLGHLDKDEGWFRVGALSPDDLDLDLDVYGLYRVAQELRVKAKEWLDRAHVWNTRYDVVLRDLQAHLGTGHLEGV